MRWVTGRWNSATRSSPLTATSCCTTFPQSSCGSRRHQGSTSPRVRFREGAGILDRVVRTYVWSWEVIRTTVQDAGTGGTRTDADGQVKHVDHWPPSQPGF